MPSALYIRDKDGNFIGIPAIRGKSAYEQAQDGGFAGTEEEFIAILNGLLNPVQVITEDDPHNTDYNNPHRVTAEQTGAIPKNYPTSADLNTELKKGDNTVTICCYYGETLNSPYKEGKTACTHGMVITNAHSSSYATQLCIPSGDDVMFLRQLSGGVVSEWQDRLWSAVNSIEQRLSGAETTASNAVTRVASVESSLSTIRTNVEGARQLAANAIPKSDKPTITYSGNGGSQTVQVGGSGGVAWLVSSDGLQGFVSKNGFMGLNSNGQSTNQVSAFISFANGVLTLNNGGLCNAVNNQYTLKVL